MSATAFQPLVPQLAVSTGMSDAMLGALFALAGITPVVIALPIGAVADSIGTRGVLMWGALVRASASLLLCFAPQFWLFFVSLTASASSFLLTEVGMQAYVAKIGTGKDTERNFGWFTFMMGIGMVVGPLVSGYLKDHAGFRIAFLAAGLMALSGIPVIASLHEPREPGPRPRVGALDLLNSLKPLLMNPGIVAAVTIPLALYFSLGAWEIYLPAFLTHKGFTGTQIGIVVSTFTFTTMIARPLLSAGTDKFGRHGLTVLTLMVAAVGLALVPAFNSVALLLISATALGVGRGLLPLVSIVTIADRARAHERGLALSLRMMTIRLQAVVHPLAFGAAAGAFGVPVVFVFGGGLLAASGALIWVSRSFRHALSRLESG